MKLRLGRHQRVRIAAVMAISVLMIVMNSAAAASDGIYGLALARGSRLMVAAKVNRHRVTALLDSAAEITLVDREWARQLHLQESQQVSGQGSGDATFDVKLVTGVTLESVGLRLENQTIGLTDLSDIGRRLLHRRIVAILGREIFDAARLSIDIEGGKISVVGREREPRGARLDLVTEHGVETVPVRIESSGLVRATFDLGNGAHVLIGSALAKRMGFLTDGREVSAELGGGLGGETNRRVFQLRRLEIAGIQLHNVQAAVDSKSSASDVNIGVSVLRHFRITTDFANHLVWLDPRM